MTQKGNHTWDIVHQYHRCPECGFINESRDDYQYELGKYVKDITCGRCGFGFSLQKNSKPTPGPFFGEGDTVEIDWSGR